MLESKTLAGGSIERLIDAGYSQIPVKNGSGAIIGIFSWKTFGKRVCELKKTKLNPTQLKIQHTMEPAKFIDANVYIDTSTNWNDVDYVLVGAPDKLLGILSVADVLGRLNDFAEAFVLLFEIEHEIRDLIHELVDEAGITQMISEMDLPPNSRTKKLLEEFTFNQYKSLICAKANWITFEPIFDTMRELVDIDLGEINELRNVVFHFRRALAPKDTDRLRRFLDRLTYDRELFRKQNRLEPKL